MADFDTLKGDLAFKEGELDKSKNTVQSLKSEHMSLQNNLDKVMILFNTLNIAKHVFFYNRNNNQFYSLETMRISASSKFR